MKKWRPYVALAVVGIIVFVLSFFLLRLITPQAKRATYAEMDPVYYQAKLELVRYFYDALVPVKKNEKLQHLFIAPMEITGALDLEQIEYQLSTSRKLRVVLPRPDITRAQITDWDSVKSYNVGRTFLNLSILNQDKDLTRLLQALKESKDNVYKSAILNGIEVRTQKAGEEFLEKWLGQLGIQAEFVMASEDGSSPAFEGETWEGLSASRKRNLLRDIKFRLARSVFNQSGK